MVEWRWSDQWVDYPAALSWMEARVGQIFAGQAGECIWLLEHPPLITAGSSANPKDLLEKQRFDVFHAGRGGQYTYHGPGQRIGYVMLDLRQRGQDVRRFVWLLEQWLIAALAECGVQAERREGRIGLWVVTPEGQESKIAAVGLRLRRWISFHGFSVNIAPDLSHYDAIVPCGLNKAEYGVTSMHALGYAVTLAEFDQALQRTFTKVL